MKRTREEEHSSPIVKINAGGVFFSTHLDTLTKSFPLCKLAEQFSNLSALRVCSDGHYFVDMNPSHFAVVLDILRNPALLDHPAKEMSEGVFNAIVEHQNLRQPYALNETLEIKKESISRMYKSMLEREYKTDQEVFELLIKWIDLTAFLASDESTETVYLPIGVFSLEDGTDMADYVSLNKEQLQGLLDLVTDKRVKLIVTPGGSLSPNLPKTIAFEGVAYDTAVTNVLEVTMEIQ